MSDTILSTTQNKSADYRRKRGRPKKRKRGRPKKYQTNLSNSLPLSEKGKLNIFKLCPNSNTEYFYQKEEYYRKARPYRYNPSYQKGAEFQYSYLRQRSFIQEIIGKQSAYEPNGRYDKVARDGQINKYPDAILQLILYDYVEVQVVETKYRKEVPITERQSYRDYNTTVGWLKKTVVDVGLPQVFGVLPELREHCSSFNNKPHIVLEEVIGIGNPNYNEKIIDAFYDMIIDWLGNNGWLEVIERRFVWTREDGTLLIKKKAHKPRLKLNFVLLYYDPTKKRWLFRGYSILDGEWWPTLVIIVRPSSSSLSTTLDELRSRALTLVLLGLCPLSLYLSLGEVNL